MIVELRTSRDLLDTMRIGQVLHGVSVNVHCSTTARRVFPFASEGVSFCFPRIRELLAGHGAHEKG